MDLVVTIYYTNYLPTTMMKKSLTIIISAVDITVLLLTEISDYLQLSPPIQEQLQIKRNKDSIDSYPPSRSNTMFICTVHDINLKMLLNQYKYRHKRTE